MIRNRYNQIPNPAQDIKWGNAKDLKDSLSPVHFYILVLVDYKYSFYPSQNRVLKGSAAVKHHISTFEPFKRSIGTVSNTFDF